MRNKNIKKHPSAQALSDDELESVGGGYYTHGVIGNRNPTYVFTGFSSEDFKKLEDDGVKVVKAGKLKGLDLYKLYVPTLTTKGIVDKPITREYIHGLLGPESY